MTGKDFDRTADAVAKQISFTERLGRSEAEPQATVASEESVRDSAYRAYGCFPSDKIGETCDIQGWLENSDVAQGIEIQYRFLMQVAYVGEEQLRLFLPDAIVLIEGANLRDLRKKLARRQVTFIQQYSTRIWNAAPVKGEPIVEKIEVIRPNSESGMR